MVTHGLKLVATTRRSIGNCTALHFTYIDVADNDRVAVGVQKVLAFGIATQHDRLAAGRAGQCRIDELCAGRKRNVEKMFDYERSSPSQCARVGGGQQVSKTKTKCEASG